MLIIIFLTLNELNKTQKIRRVSETALNQAYLTDMSRKSPKNVAVLPFFLATQASEKRPFIRLCKLLERKRRAIVRNYRRGERRNCAQKNRRSCFCLPAPISNISPVKDAARALSVRFCEVGMGVRKARRKR
jgi:hypothetical protein